MHGRAHAYMAMYMRENKGPSQTFHPKGYVLMYSDLQSLQADLLNKEYSHLPREGYCTGTSLPGRERV